VGADSRVADLERRVAALETALGAGAAAASTPDEPGAPDERFWVLDALKRRFPDTGAVVYAGAVSTSDGPVEWQYGALANQMLEQDWSAFAKVLDALGHPVRLGLLQTVLSGVQTVAALGESAAFGTSGQIYHHLNILVAAGWLVARARGRYAVPAERVVPLLVILTAARGGGP